jgi:hypothetical protein
MSKKVTITSDEVENVLKMLLSTDEDNKYLAYEIMENCDHAKSNGALMLLIKFSNLPGLILEKNIPKTIQHLKKEAYLLADAVTLTMPALFHRMLARKEDKSIMELFIKLHNQYLTNIMEAWGYPMKDFSVTLTQKEDV